MAFGPDDLLALYAKGQFPMANDRGANSVSIIEPDWRGLLPLHALHIPRRLRRTIKQDVFRVPINQDFAACIEACAKATPTRTDTWISHGIEHLCQQLHHQTHAHSVECYEGETLVGGLYGITLGGVFFGESMFSRRTNASKVALFHLCARLIRQGFSLLDTQFLTDHLASFGAIEIDRKSYLARLQLAKTQSVHFAQNPEALGGRQVLEILDAHYLQSSTQTS